MRKTKKTDELNAYKKQLKKVLKVIDLVQDGMSENKACEKMNLTPFKFRYALNQVNRMSADYIQNPWHPKQMDFIELKPEERLYADIMGYLKMTPEIFASIPRDVNRLMNHLIRTRLNKKQTTVIRCIYWEQLTLERTGAILRVSRQAVGQHKLNALKRLRKPDALAYLKNGKELDDIRRSRKRAIIKRPENPKTGQNIPVTDLNLSYRSAHYLTEHGIEDLTGISDWPMEALLFINGLGVSSMQEIARVYEQETGHALKHMTVLHERNLNGTVEKRIVDTDPYAVIHTYRELRENQDPVLSHIKYNIDKDRAIVISSLSPDEIKSVVRKNAYKP